MADLDHQDNKALVFQPAEDGPIFANPAKASSLSSYAQDTQGLLSGVNLAAPGIYLSAAFRGQGVIGLVFCPAAAGLLGPGEFATGRGVHAPGRCGGTAE